jgi:hypothetical protein
MSLIVTNQKEIKKNYHCTVLIQAISTICIDHLADFHVFRNIYAALIFNSLPCRLKGLSLSSVKDI